MIADMSKGVKLRGKDELVYELNVEGSELEYILKLMHLEWTLDESGTDEAECYRKMARGEGNGNGLRHVYARVLHKNLLHE